MVVNGTTFLQQRYATGGPFKTLIDAWLATRMGQQISVKLQGPAARAAGRVPRIMGFQATTSPLAIARQETVSTTSQFLKTVGFPVDVPTSFETVSEPTPLPSPPGGTIPFKVIGATR